MRTRQLLVALILGLALILPAAPGGQALSDRPAGDPVPLALERPALHLLVDPTPTPVVPPPPPGEPVDDPALPQEIADVPGVTEDWWAGVLEQIRLDLYALTPEEVEVGPPTYRGHNPAHNLNLAFGASGLRLAPAPPPADPMAEPADPTATTTAAEAGPGWGWELRFNAYGYQGYLEPVPAALETRSDGNRLEYRRAGLSEWYVNDERGLEQGFTLDAPPPGDGHLLVLEMALDTDLVPLVTTEQAIEFALPAGNVILLRYGDLAAYDATGSPLPSRMELSDCGPGSPPDACRLRLLVDTAGAVYPLTVDPLVTAPPWSAAGEDDGVRFGYSVATAGDVNGDGYDDLVIGADGYQGGRGKVYLYHGSPAGLAETPAWTKTGENPPWPKPPWPWPPFADHFGRSVATAGDVNGDGYSDVVIGAPSYRDATSLFSIGKAYVYHGSPAGLGADPAWSAVGELTLPIPTEFGHSVGTAGDVNGDGFDDVVIGAPQYPVKFLLAVGKVYVYQGSGAGLRDTPAWTWQHQKLSWYGFAVGTAGDVNDDGFADLVVGAPAFEDYTGEAFVYYGSEDGPFLKLWYGKGQGKGDFFGSSVGTAGDVDADGCDDLVVGAPGYGGQRGKVYVYHGSKGGLGDHKSPDWTAKGENVGDLFGRSVATAGDVNNDDFDDLVVSAEGYDNDRGKVYFYHGSSDGLEVKAGWIATGEHAGDYFGGSDGPAPALATAGDVNGDGYSDLVVGAHRYDGGRGKAYVYHGSALGLIPLCNWIGAGENAQDAFGAAVATAGDVNGDGYSDVAIGAYGYDDGRGKAYVYHGSAAGLADSPAWSDAGQDAGDHFGRAVMTAGDVNDDGYDDLAVGAWGYSNKTGRAYLYPGSEAGLAATAVWTATGQHPGDSFGLAVGAAGDVDADGYDDLVIGAAGYPQGKGNGKAYVFHGSPAGLGTAAAWSDSGESAGSHFGYAVGTAGDVNGDGRADLVVGAWGYDDIGRAYVYYGSDTGLGAEPWTATGEQVGDYFGWSAGAAGDVNGDGYADLAAGAWGYDDALNGNDAGRVTIYHGSPVGLGETPAWTAVGAQAGDHFGYVLATAGDEDGDGYADLLVGAAGEQAGAGKAYLYPGSATGLADSPTWTATGVRSADHYAAALGTAGDVNGDGYSDLVVGARGYDEARKTNAGRAYVYHGAARGLGDTPAFTAASGVDPKAGFGRSVAMAGDVNGDGYADLVIGEHGYARGRGKAYVYHGSADGLSRIPSWTAEGEDHYNRFGWSVATAGDVNGDGYADLVVGAYGYSASRGKAYVYHGSADGLGSDPAWAAVCPDVSAGFGWSVATAGDVNGDGYADLAVGAWLYGAYRGRAYVYHGSATGLGDTPAWTASGEDTQNAYGKSVASAGDVNGDGYADLVVGAPEYSQQRGKAYVYYGGPAGLTPGPADWTAAGQGVNNRLGSSVATAGDVNGDGYADLVVGAPRAGDYRGMAYVYHGSPLGLDVPFSVFAGGSEGVGSWFGFTVATAGDVNGDGYADLAVGAHYHYTQTGRVTVYHGSAVGLSAGYQWVAAGEHTGDTFGSVVAPAGDVNGDGYADLAVGAEWYDEERGKVYVYQGNDGGGRAGRTRQARGDGSGKPVQPWGPSYTHDSFGVSLHGVDPLGHGRARLQVQACPPGAPFEDAACLAALSDNWIPVSSGGDVDLSHVVTETAVLEGVLYRWRARALYDSPLYPHGPWRRLIGQALEADVRVTRPTADLSLTKSMHPADPVTTGQKITYTLTFSSTGPARGVVITDILSSDITNTHVISSGVAISDTGHEPCCVWSVGDLEAGQGGVIIITGTAQAERFLNTATITGTSPDPNPDNNRATVQTHITGTIYVDRDAGGANNGLSWANAYTDLQDALAEARAGDQIWVAGGVYRPVASGHRNNSFHLVSGVALHGGFAGGESWLHERDPAAQPTILSGDIGTVGDPDDNAYHVITASNILSSTLLEGLIISAGNADGNADDGRGGGIFINGGRPTLINVALIGNAADEGGGLYNVGGSPTLVNVAFSGNTAKSEGGGMFNLSGSPVLTNVTFSRNEASSGGGIYHAGRGAFTLSNAILWGNTGGQIAVDGNTPTIRYPTIRHSNVQGGCPSRASCDQVTDHDPQLWDPEGEDGRAGTLDDDLRIYTTFRHPSPVIDAGDSDALPKDRWDLDGDGVTDELLPLDLSGRWRRIGFTEVVTPPVDLGAYEATIVDVLAEGGSLFEQGEAFRLENLQLLSADTLAEALKNYANFNDGEWYYAFCADYDQVDEHGYCPASDPQAVRNTLLDAVDLYRVAVGWPTDVFTTVHEIEIPVWESGSRGVLSATTEIANVHLVFGNEFLVDATDYRFSTAGIPYADQIIAQELDELDQAQRQFELIMDLIVRAFNEWDVGDYCGGDQFEQFGVASSLLMSTLNEIAARRYMLRQSEEALGVYDQAYRDQYLHMMALAEMAAGSGQEYLQDGSWEMLNNLSQMRERAQAIHDGLDFFGFAPEYVPLQAYEHLLVLSEGPTGQSGLLGTARDLEDQARDAQRTFDANASDMATELDNLRVELKGQLFELCGASEDDYETCEGGLMDQNFQAMDAASLRVGLAYLRAQNIAGQIQIEEERAGQVINVHLGLGRELSAAELAIGKLQAHRETRTSMSSAEYQLYAGVEAKAEYYLQSESTVSINPFKSGAKTKSGFKASVEASAGFRFAGTWTNSTQEVWDPTAEAIADYESLQALKQAEAQAEIEGANSAAVVRNLLLQQSEALQEYQIAMAELNKLAAEHDYLAERHSRLLNLLYQADHRVASHNSHLLSPAYRIWRDSLTTQSMQAHALAAQFAYLTARAAEYELLTPYPDLGQIFRARTANDIRLFLDGLKVWTQALDLPGQLNRYPYTLSLARDIWGLTDQALDRDGTWSSKKLERVRYEEFQNLLQGHLDGGRLEFWFGTALDQQRGEGQYLFSPNIWVNRIAGIGTPMAQNEGVSINIVTRQSDDVGEPEVVLIHGGWAGGAEAYRNAAGQIVYYDPDTAVPVGYLLPDALDPDNTTAVLRPGINGAGAIANGALMNLSVAASTWTFRIPAESRGDLDYSQIEDIEIVLDTTGRALPGQAAAAEQDALRLQAGLPMEPVEIGFSISAPPPAATRRTLGVTAPSIPGQIGGSYFGNVIVTDPVTIALQVLNFDLWNVGGVLSGTVNVTETSLYSGHIGLHGIAAGEAFSLTSDPFITVVAGRPVTQAFSLAGHAEEGGDVLKATYTCTITNLLPDPIPVQGSFSASRPGAVGSERLRLEADDWAVSPWAKTAIRATLYDATMAPITEPRTLTFTTDLGTVVPAVADTVDGVAVVKFKAGKTQGQATVWATTGEITGVVRIQVSTGLDCRFSADPTSGLLPSTVTFTDESSNGPTSWAWSFGDGGTSAERHPTHTYDQAGSYTVTLTVSNALGSDTRIEPNYVTVEPNESPIAHEDNATTEEDSPITIQVLSDDDDPDGHPLTVVSVGDPAHGEASTDGSSVTYTPHPDYNGSDSFDYTVSDGALTTSATVAVTVTAINDPPTLSDCPDQFALVGTPVGPLPFTIRDVDTPLGDLVLSAASSDSALVPTGNILLGGSGAERNVTVEPAADLTGIVTITLTVSDGELSASSAFELTVGEKPLETIYLPLLLRDD